MPLHLFTGDEWLRTREIVQLTQQLRVRSAVPWVEIRFDGEEFAWQRFAQALHTSPLFPEGVILHVKRVEKLPDPEALAQSLARPLPAERCVILEAERLDKRSRLYQLISRHGQVHDHPRLDRRSIPALTQKLLQEHGVRLSSAGLRYLLDSVEGNPFRLAHEMEKLALYSSGREASLTDLKGLLFHDRGGDLFGCLDALLERKPGALPLLGELLDGGEEPAKVFFLLASQIRAILLIQSLAATGSSTDEIARRTGDYPWRISKRREIAQQFTAQELIERIHQLHREDLRIKRGERQPEEALWALALSWVESA
jgi:DNA polymerase III delta subunit